MALAATDLIGDAFSSGNMHCTEESMRDTANLSYLAIDGGGTRCRFALVLDGQMVREEGGAANVSTDFTAAVSVIKAGIRALAQNARVDAEMLYGLPAFVGVAGVTGLDMTSRLSAALTFTNVRYADDRPAVLKSALDKREGMIAHCGTGSFFGCQKRGKQTFVGGWGAKLGDEASALWVGHTLLKRSLQAKDGLRPMTDLPQATLEGFGDAPGVVRFAVDASTTEIAALAPMVTEAFQSGDALATEIMQDGADHVSGMMRHLGWTKGLPIALTGGIASHYVALLPAEMAHSVEHSATPPIEGALALARDQAESAE